LNKRKIINDPVHGFIHIPNELIFDLIEHPFFQRLRRIKQLGMAEYIYPGALHTRFHHALGAMHLMGQAIINLRRRGIQISNEEAEAVQVAILLHDIGHGPMSHALEASILQDVPHEKLSLLLMQELNAEFDGKLTLAIQIFTNQYSRKFFHQLVSSQLDMDRLDYLQRDSFFTGVQEGKIGAERILKMLVVKDDQLAIEEKGIYSIENFLTARRLMYWQVYFHKANISADAMLTSLIKRAKKIAKSTKKLEGSDALLFFLKNDIHIENFKEKKEYIYKFAQLDDYDIWSAIKQWVFHQDKILSLLSKHLLNRRLFKVELKEQKYSKEKIKNLREKITQILDISFKGSKYLVINGIASNEAYISKENKIYILTKKQQTLDIAQASDLPNIKALRKIVKKYYLCWFKEANS